MDMETAITPNTDKPWLWKPGQSGNPLGRPKGTFKDYLKRKFTEMTDEEKEEFARTISHEMQVKLAEGNPHQSADVKQDGTVIIKIQHYGDNDSLPVDTGTAPTTSPPEQIEVQGDSLASESTQDNPSNQ